jgi:hypothetical protein
MSDIVGEVNCVNLSRDFATCLSARVLFCVPWRPAPTNTRLNGAITSFTPTKFTVVCAYWLCQQRPRDSGIFDTVTSFVFYLQFPYGPCVQI